MKELQLQNRAGIKVVVRYLMNQKQTQTDVAQILTRYCGYGGYGY